MRRWLQYGGFAAGIVLIIFGVVAIAMGASGRSTVSDSLRKEQIVGTPDMTPAAIKAEAKAAGSRECLAADAATWQGRASLRGQTPAALPATCGSTGSRQQAG